MLRVEFHSHSRQALRSRIIVEHIECEYFVKWHRPVAIPHIIRWIVRFARIVASEAHENLGKDDTMWHWGNLSGRMQVLVQLAQNIVYFDQFFGRIEILRISHADKKHIDEAITSALVVGWCWENYSTYMWWFPIKDNDYFCLPKFFRVATFIGIALRMCSASNFTNLSRESFRESNISRVICWNPTGVVNWLIFPVFCVRIMSVTTMAALESKILVYKVSEID